MILQYHIVILSKAELFYNPIHLKPEQKEIKEKEFFFTKPFNFKLFKIPIPAWAPRATVS